MGSVYCHKWMEETGVSFIYTQLTCASLVSICVFDGPAEKCSTEVQTALTVPLDSLSTVQKLHVQQPGERSVLHHRFRIGLHMLRRHFKGEVLLSSRLWLTSWFCAVLPIIAPGTAVWHVSAPYWYITHWSFFVVVYNYTERCISNYLKITTMKRHSTVKFCLTFKCKMICYCVSANKIMFFIKGTIVEYFCSLVTFSLGKFNGHWITYSTRFQSINVLLL